MNFTAVYMKVLEGYIAFVEELPGANTQGGTLEEARANFEGSRGDGFGREPRIVRAIAGWRGCYSGNTHAPRCVKHTDLIRHLGKNGCEFQRQGDALFGGIGMWTIS